jgi:hypothetical protein
MFKKASADTRLAVYPGRSQMDWFEPSITPKLCRAAAIAIGCFAAALSCATPAGAGLINPTSTVDPYFDYVDPSLGPLEAPSTGFSTGTQGPFSLSAPIIPGVHTTEPYNLAAITGFFFTDTTVTIYNNADPPIAFCENGYTGSSCNDPYNEFDFKFTNENITGVAVDPNSAADFAPVSLTLLGPNEFTVDVTGDDPAYLSQLIIDLSFAAPSQIPLPATLPLFASGLGALGLLVWRRKRKHLLLSPPPEQNT